MIQITKVELVVLEHAVNQAVAFAAQLGDDEDSQNALAAQKIIERLTEKDEI